MIQILKFSDSDFAVKFQRIERRADEIPDGIEETVKTIIADVRKRGDTALFELSAKFDQIDLITELRQKLGCRVDVVSARALNRHLRKRVLDEAISL